MAKISTYATTTPTTADLILGTDVGSSDATKNFTVSSILDLQDNLTVKDEGVNVTTDCTSIDIVGSHIAATAVGGAVTITESVPDLVVKDEGVNVTTACTSIDVVGAGVAATAVGGAVTMTFPGRQATDTVTLSKVDILALSGGVSSFTVIAAPGANKVIVPQGIFVEIFNSTPYTGSSSGIDLYGGGTELIQRVSNVFTSTTPKKFFANGLSSPISTGATSILTNNALTIKSSGGGTITDAGSSDITIKLTVIYTILDV
tara:strand:- start:3103 stop:3882 length:780 start_codon:yes stop_codon:yes gene_type:complete